MENNKQETLEEAAESYNDDFQIKGGSKAPHIKNQHIMNHFIAGANYQAERMYSEEDMRKAYDQGIDDSFDIGFSSKDDTNFNVFIEQFKKK